VTALPEFSGDAAVCPKCDLDDADTAFRPQHPQLSWDTDGTLIEVVTHGHDGPETLSSEHECLLRRCRECGWAWLETCADAKAGKDTRPIDAAG
jgi:hypothetical protein